MIIGIDPGKNGAIVVRHAGRITMFDIPKDKENNIDVEKLAGIFKSIQHWSVVSKLVAVIEKVHALPREGVTSSFNFGYINGLLVMAATIYFDKVVFVTPMRWKKDLGLTESGLEYKQKKDKARLFAIELFPQAAKDLRLKKHNDRAEALLLTEWYIRKGK